MDEISIYRKVQKSRSLKYINRKTLTKYVGLAFEIDML